MEVIPVIDLKDGIAVHARRGDRANYRPLATPLCPDCDPLAVARAYRAVYPFATLYVADLDAILGRGNNDDALAALRAALPAVSLWVDRGLADATACRAWLARDLGRAVLGSETLRDVAELAALGAERADGEVVLSLDFQGDAFMGPDALLDAPETWPDDVVVMTLARVGSDSGPDWQRLAGLQAKTGARRLYAAGGVRGLDDLERLAAQGIAGALIASSLHERRLAGAAIAALGSPALAS